MKNKSFSLISFLTIFLLTSCSEIKTTDLKEIYTYWTGSSPLPELKLLDGQYWQSSHWTKEYIMYLKLKPTKVWWSKFIEANHVSVYKGEWKIPSDAPIWFQPSKSSLNYKSSDDIDQGSRYFRDTLTEVCYIYEIQL